MKLPAEPKRFPAWLRFLGWLTFSMLAVATVLIVARWWVLRSGHQRTQELVKQSRRFPHVSISHGATGKPAESTSMKPAVSRGTPLASVPHFGDVLTGDRTQWREFSAKFRGIYDFLWRHKQPHPEYVDGVWSFRGIIQNMGTDVPESMTEAEAAAEYLKLADQFSVLLGQWREAVAIGPLDAGGPADSEINPGNRFRGLSATFNGLLAMTAEARLRTGDAAGAWADWQTMKHSAERAAELDSTDTDEGNISSYTRGQMFGLARSGLRSGLWTDDQLSELSSEVARGNALRNAQRDLEFEKAALTDYYSHFHEHENEINRDVLKTPSQVNQMMNRLAISLTTDQQIRDNVDLMHSRVDQRLRNFDPETGFYVRPSEEEIAAYREAQKSSGTPYFIYANAKQGNGDPDPSTAAWVIQVQSELDQFRLAAALETYQHRTGEYPDRLDAISSRFPDGAPRDIATGQPYFYQREPDGGYKLWGTGIDGKSEGGDAKTDVTWTKRPVKTK